MNPNALHSNIEQKKEYGPAAGFFAQPFSENANYRPVSSADSANILEENQKLLNMFIRCSGMQLYMDKINDVIEGKGDEVILQALVNGPKVTLEDFCAILNNNAVYASLFLSSTIGLLFSPPDVITKLDEFHLGKGTYMVGILLSVVFNILNILIAVFVFAAKNKILRDSDALGYLLLAQSSTIISGSFLTIGITGMIIAVWPVLYYTYGIYAFTLALIIFIGIIIPLVLWLFKIYISRHTKYYYMKNGQVATHNEHAMETQKMKVSEQAKIDPYDPTIAWHTYLQSARIGHVLASRDSNKSGIVSMHELIFNDQELREIYKNLFPNQNIFSSMKQMRTSNKVVPVNDDNNKDIIEHLV